MNRAATIIATFGGASKLARALGLRHVSVVQSWKRSGIIPARRQQAVLDAAGALGIELSPADFFERQAPASNDDSAEGQAA